MSSRGSKTTGTASSVRPPARTRMPRVSAPGDHVRVRHDIAGATTKPVPTVEKPQVAAETLSVLASAAAAIARAVGSVGRSTGGPERLEADEDVGQPGRVEPAAETDRELGRWRQDGGHRPDRRRVAGHRRQARDRAHRQQAPRQPDDEERLDDPETGPDRPICGAQEPVTEPPRERPAHGGAERFADGDRAHETAQDDDRPEGRIDARQRVGQRGEGHDGSHPSGDRPEQTRDLRQRTRSPAEDERHDDEDERDGVEFVHRVRGPVSSPRRASRSGADAPPPRR